MEITDDMCRRAIEAMAPDRIQGFSTPRNERGGVAKWGAPHTIRDVWRRGTDQLIWTGDTHEEMMERCKIEEMRIALSAALDIQQIVGTETK